MSGLIPFEQCIARPKEQGKVYWLKDHLLGVKAFIESRITKEDCLLNKLAGLAGFCHDMAKAHVEWQHYANKKRKQGPNHGPEGAFLFSYLGYHLLKTENQWKEYALYWLWLTRDIADHHGSLKSINENRWIGAGDWDKMDLQGITNCIHQVYPEFQDITITEQVMDQWTEEVFDIFEEAEETIDLGYTYIPPEKLMKKLSYWRELTTALIAGDRFDVSPTSTTWLSEKDHIDNDQVLEAYCRKQKDQAMAAVRKEAQRQILQQLEDKPNQRIYTLEMPTGYGKTITALKIATWLGMRQGYRKIVYVAPYLSILEQTSNVIEDALDTFVLEHHSLAVLEVKNGKENKEEFSGKQLMMEAWANSIVCTSFQQWSKALFPGRAQDVLRRAYLRDSIVIIDEPQIFAPEGWNVFLCGLEAVAELYNLRVIFLSATMPPFDFGLSENPACLSVEPVEKLERYQVVQAGEMDEKSLARFLLSKEETLPGEGKTQAAILNTIGDAYGVYKELLREAPEKNVKLLQGMMAPLHKRVEIEKIKDLQERKENDPLYVVSTQIIEAGVNLSFQHIVRALPILPSIIQAAGRVNRHFEGKLGTLSLILFLREGEKNTRGSVYPRDLQKLTDKLLSKQEVWLESEILQLIKVYYQKMFGHNSFETGKQAITDAYEGDWPALSAFKPFGEDYPRLPIFVPWQVPEEDIEYLPEKFIKLQQRLKIYLPESIYEHYEDKEFYSGLSFEKKKEFMILFNHYVVNIPDKLAFSLAGKDMYEKNRIPILLNTEEYDPAAGLAKRSVEGFDNMI